ncbi:MAG: hypothetical protein HC834_04360 [Rhodospirillales bacterium]|nr:hypothetical protein [Rhodospirillales bacterium]
MTETFDRIWEEFARVDAGYRYRQQLQSREIESTRDELSSVATERETASQSVATLSGELEAVRTSLETANAILADTQNQLEVARHDNLVLVHTNAQLRTEADQLKGSLTKSRAKLEKMKNRPAWRFTRPFRALYAPIAPQCPLRLPDTSPL